ncbi:hypothetical protein Patl1_16199 [Pistacia atlantica]|uniref:Uncharacterized protein n=1 Tax=Pistacia atlantica TaxID=434234 RepID=A0ACC1BAU5_9ROSI|nr:hypothetical protein Patl1_16199 [Pistacia atlantica]
MVERNPNAWKLRPDLELLAIAFSAVFSAALRGLVHTWAFHKKGALYVSMFKPLSVVIAVAMGVTFLGDTLYLGSVLGAAIIAFGFYSLIWGQGQEEKMIDDKGINNLKPFVLNSPSSAKQKHGSTKFLPQKLTQCWGPDAEIGSMSLCSMKYVYV